MKELSSDAEERTIQLLKKINVRPPRQPPAALTPPGLDFVRQKYLFDKIRDYCMSDKSKDIVCPKPRPPPGQRVVDDVSDNSDD
jgi:hypothetical protein